MKGGKAFTAEYLGPILDPLLSSMTIVSGLFSDIAALHGRMQSMVDPCSHEQLERKLKLLCQRLNSNEDASVGRPCDLSTTFSLAYVASSGMRLDRKG